jgi:hypothetical protein
LQEECSKTGRIRSMNVKHRQSAEARAHSNTKATSLGGWRVPTQPGKNLVSEDAPVDG